ncbi:hypothetical protein FN846DRAFT_947856 [Sphaerosporella brunnea]|uniref:Uncharacterized protein n=1 Tax=Sphaerosporella brunnea TaxID=1250544 RepID=A0A5J5EXW2_9PEZI|nr:hypothetical protein FN846DRAFT_947847 [Sphaerosporella brunnea]KAA8906802.1 hypothetical protein FN846DRAFT_947856 [Sphaerosporella brunnea]
MLEEMNRRRQQQETPGAQPSETPNQQQQGMEVPPSNVYSTHTERAAYINYTLRRSQGSVQGSGSGGGSSQVPRLPEYPRGSPGEDSTGISGSPSSDNPLSPQRGSVTTTGSGSTLVNPHYAPTMLPPPPNLPYAPSATSTNQQPTFHDLRCIRSRTPTPGIIDGTQPNQTSLLEPRTHDGRSYYHPQFQCWLPFPTEVPAEDEAVHPGTKQLVMEKMQRLKDRMLGRKKKVRKNKISAPVGPAPPPVLGGQMIRITPPQVRFQVEEGGREDGGA